MRGFAARLMLPGFIIDLMNLGIALLQNCDRFGEPAALMLEQRDLGTVILRSFARVAGNRPAGGSEEIDLSLTFCQCRDQLIAQRRFLSLHESLNSRA